MPTSHSLAVPGTDLAYDVRGPLPPADGRPPLLMVGQPAVVLRRVLDA